MTIDWWTLGLQAINALVLLWILARFLFRPVSRIIVERQTAATEALNAARAAKDEADAALAKARADSDAVLARHAELIGAAEREADAEKAALMAKARAEADALRAELQSEMAREKQAQTVRLQNDAATLAADIAGRLLARLPETARVTGFIDGLAEAVAELPEATRAGIGADGPVPVTAARAMTEDEVAALTARLTEVLGRPVTLAPSVAPTLIAGLELDAAHAVVRNHLGADLDRVRQELIQHD